MQEPPAERTRLATPRTDRSRRHALPHLEGPPEGAGGEVAAGSRAVDRQRLPAGGGCPASRSEGSPEMVAWSSARCSLPRQGRGGVLARAAGEPLAGLLVCHKASRVHATGTGRRLGGQDCRRVEPCRRCHPSVRSRRGPYVNSDARPGRRPENGPCAAAAQATGSPSGRTARRSTRSVPDQKDVPAEFGCDSLGLRAALPVTSPRWSSAMWCSCPVRDGGRSWLRPLQPSITA